MAIHTVRRIAARLSKAGESRVLIHDAAKADEALTSDDVRELIQNGGIQIIPARGVGRGKAKLALKRRRQGRGRGKGSVKGAKHGRLSHKEKWMKKVRAQRNFLQTAKPRLADGAFKKVYKMVKGNAFRDRRQLATYLTDNKLYK